MFVAKIRSIDVAFISDSVIPVFSIVVKAFKVFEIEPSNGKDKI
jgi:hypothetical protein